MAFFLMKNCFGECSGEEENLADEEIYTSYNFCLFYSASEIFDPIHILWECVLFFLPTGSVKVINYKANYLLFLSPVILKSITIQTLYLNSMWLPPHSSMLAFLNQIIFVMLSALTAFNFVMAAVLGPFYLPYGWKPKNKKHESYLQLCAVCPGTYKAPRAHHCRKCDRCVAKMVSWM